MSPLPRLALLHFLLLSLIAQRRLRLHQIINRVVVAVVAVVAFTFAHFGARLMKLY